MNKKLLFGLAIAATATTAVIIGILRELKQIRDLTIDADELAEEIVNDLQEVQILAEEEN
jgi:hypothetical protein